MTNAFIEVSVITGTYNAEAFIQRTIESVLHQTFGQWELIITDDCSSDSTVKIVEKYMDKDDRITLNRQASNMGVDHARNNSIKMARGRFIAFLDADDLWLPSKLEEQIKFMKQNNVDLSYTSYYQIDRDGRRNGKLIKAKKELNYRELLKNNYIGCLTVVYDTSRIGKVYMPNLRKRQDWAAWLKISKLTNSIRGIDKPLAEYRIYNNSLSRNKLNLIKYNWKVYKEIEGFSILKSAILFTRFLFYFLLKKV